MSVKATDRAWDSGAKGNELLVLLALADAAGSQDDPYDYAYPSIGRLMDMTRLSKSTVHRCLRALEEAGWIRRTGEHVWKAGKVTIQYRIEQGCQVDTGVDSGPSGVSGVTPNPSPNPSQGKGSAPAQASADPRTRPPEDFPDELLPHAREVYKILASVAADQPNARKVWPRAVCRVVAGHPRHPLVQTAHALAAWAVDPPRPLKDVVATYRTFLEKEREMAAIEALDGARPRRPANVAPIRGREPKPWDGAITELLEEHGHGLGR